MKHTFFFGLKGLDIWYLGVFRVADYESELKIQKFKMADPIRRTKMWSQVLDRDEIWYSGDFITNPSSVFINSKWWIQYGRPNLKKLLDWDEIWYSAIFGIADYEFNLNIQKFKMVNAIRWTKIQKVTWLG